MQADVSRHVWQGLLDAPSFSLWLDPDPAAQPAGSLTFGGVNAALYTGMLMNVTVISSKCVSCSPAPLCFPRGKPRCREWMACLDRCEVYNQSCSSRALAVHGFPTGYRTDEFRACRYWMVPLLGVQAGSVALPITARGAILDSSSALNLVTDRDFALFEVSSLACRLPMVAAHGP